MMTNADTFDMQCVDETHVDGCPCQAGGEPMYRCFICGRDTSDGDYVNIARNDGSVARCCNNCYEKRDEEYLTTGLDYTEDEPNREGMPEFNGAFRG
jgi:hypothetical protein